eukprot:8387431-Prorocentrum_lima.AAC.1
MAVAPHGVSVEPLPTRVVVTVSWLAQGSPLNISQNMHLLLVWLKFCPAPSVSQGRDIVRT